MERGPSVHQQHKRRAHLPNPHGKSPSKTNPIRTIATKHPSKQNMVMESVHKKTDVMEGLDLHPRARLVQQTAQGVGGLVNGALQRVRGNNRGQGLRDDDQNETTDEQPRNRQGAHRWHAALLRKKRDIPSNNMRTRARRQGETRYDLRNGRIHRVKTQ